MDVRVTNDGSRTLLSKRFRQTYHSEYGALTEARHVYLEGSGTARRLAQGRPTTVLEIGFGAGLNALITLAEAARWGTPVRMVSLECYLLPVELLRALDYRSLLAQPALADRLLDWLEAWPDGVLARAFEAGGSRLEVLLVDATAAALPSRVDAIYHDAFSPDANPELWTAAFLGRLHAALAESGTLTSYTVKGEVRRRLAEVGFQVAKAPGPPGGKREMLLARRSSEGAVGP